MSARHKYKHTFAGESPIIFKLLVVVCKLGMSRPPLEVSAPPRLLPIGSGEVIRGVSVPFTDSSSFSLLFGAHAITKTPTKVVATP